jgi:exodeoxyribonuclease VII small subunit
LSPGEEAAEPEPVSFEGGLHRLEEIAARLDRADVTVQETIALLREGRGLERALRAYLEQAEAQLREIEAGRDIPAYVVDALRAAPGGDSPG